MKNKIFKVISILLSLMVVFSACLCVFSTVSAETTEKTYYVSPNGKDTNVGTNLMKPTKTVKKIIELANTAGLGEGDTVTVKVLTTTAVAWLPDGETFLPDYTFKLIVTSQLPAGTAVIGNGSTVNMGGETEFTNIKVNFGNANKCFCANGYDVTFGVGTEFMGSATQSSFIGGAYAASKKSTYNDPYTIVNTLPIKYFGLVSNYSAGTYNGDINVVYSASAAPIFYLSSDSATKINKALNVVIKSATGVSFALRTLSGNTGSVTFGEDGYMQVVNASPTELSSGSFPAGVESSKLWVLNNKLRAADLIELTETKGKFKVNVATYQDVKAVSVADPTVVIQPVGEYLTLPAGIYNITASKIPQVGTYYVKNRGTGDGSSPDSPMGDIATALNAAVADGYIFGDIVKVMIVGDTVDMGTMPSYPYNLEIDSNDPATKPRIVTNGPIAGNAGATTTYKNVELYRADSYKSMMMQGSNLVLTPDTKLTSAYLSVVYGTGDGGGSGETVGAQKLVINSLNAPNYIYLSNWSWAKRTYTDKVELDFDVKGASTEIFLNASYQGNINGDTTYKKPVNINIKNANTILFKATERSVYEEGLQIINSGVNEINPEGELSKVSADKLYLINNISGNNNIIEFTETVGKYKVNLDNPEHELVAKNIATDNEIKYDGTSGYITLPAAAYELRIVRDPVYSYYYVDPDNGVSVTEGTRPAGVGSKGKPVLTYADATRLIAQDNLAAIDVAVVVIPSGTTSKWGSSPASFGCQLVITSSMEGDPGTLENNASANLTGNTIFRDVIFKITAQWKTFSINEHNVTIEDTATVDVPYTRVWNTAYGKRHIDDFSVVVEGVLKTNSIHMGAEYHNHISDADMNFYFNNPESAATFIFGCTTSKGFGASGPTVYNGNVNIVIKSAKSFSFSTNPDGHVDDKYENDVLVSPGYDFKSTEFNGALHLLVDDEADLPYSVKSNFEKLDVAGGKWYITNAATDDEFVSFDRGKGVLKVKDGKTAYSRQYKKDQVKHTGGTIDLSAAPGSYTVSDKAIAPLTDDSHKMLYFRLSGGSHHLSTRAKVTPGETYRFEYSIFTSLYEDCEPHIRDDGDRGITCEVKIISEKKVGNYYRIVAEGTIPEDYNHGSTACFGVNLSSYSEGVIFDRTVYNVNDPDKKNLFEGNPIFHDGLDYVTLDQAKFWGKIIHGSGMVKWTNGFEELEVMNFSKEFIAYLISLNNPNDGEWWDKDDIIKEEAFATYGKALGYFKDQNGDPVKGVKFLIASDEKSYTATSNAKGKFDFGKILTGFYDLYIVKGSEKIHTGFSSFIAQDDVVEFKVVTDTSGLVDTDYSGDSDYETNTDGENIDEIIPSGSIKGTVYTPNLEVVPGLKVVLRGYAEVVTDENGSFGFANIPVGEYELYAVNSDGSEFVFKKYTIKENGTIDVKLKYDPPLQSNSDGADAGWIIWVIVASVVALLVVGALVFVLVFKKKKV